MVKWRRGRIFNAYATTLILALLTALAASIGFGALLLIWSIAISIGIAPHWQAPGFDVVSAAINAGAIFMPVPFYGVLLALIMLPPVTLSFPAFRFANLIFAACFALAGSVRLITWRGIEPGFIHSPDTGFIVAAASVTMVALALFTNRFYQPISEAIAEWIRLYEDTAPPKVPALRAVIALELPAVLLPATLISGVGFMSQGILLIPVVAIFFIVQSAINLPGIILAMIVLPRIRLRWPAMSGWVYGPAMAGCFLLSLAIVIVLRVLDLSNDPIGNIYDYIGVMVAFSVLSGGIFGLFYKRLTHQLMPDG